jgi:predicted TPR repeat methyltransferase
MVNVVDKSIELYDKGDYDLAEKYALKAIKTDSKNPRIYINLGNINFRRNNFNDALKNYLKADSLKENYFYSKINLANTYCELKDYTHAIFYAKQAINLDSRFKLSYQILGQCYLEQKKYDDSISAFLRAMELDSSDPWLYNFLSQSYQKKGFFLDALRAGWQAVKLDGNDDAHHINFGYLLYEYDMEEIDDKAKEYAGKWLTKYPQNSVAIHMANAILNSQKITKANNDYLKNIFDAFSDDFDSILKDLDYQAPKLISAFLSKIYGKKNPKLRILDIGCGTGLCGEFLQKYKKWRALEGLDISQKMLDSARKKKLYNKLHCREVEEYLNTKNNKYNLMVAADVFTYIGDLAPLFFVVSKSLKKDGRIVFSVSENNINDEGFLLSKSGRFVHSKNYLETVLKNNDLYVEKLERHKLRNEGTKAVWGYIVSAVKTG